MNFLKRPLITLVALAALLALWPASAPQTVEAQGSLPGFRAVSGQPARLFQTPPGLVLVDQRPAGRGQMSAERYQQYVDDAQVLGGQTTVYRNAAGESEVVIGAYYPGLRGSNQVLLNQGQARAIAAQQIGEGGQWIIDLMIDPISTRFFYRAENQRFDSRWYHWIDAESGLIVNSYDGLTYGTGTGVQGDTKDLTGLTSQSGNSYRLASPDGRQTTYDAGNRNRLPGSVASDSDDNWDTAGRTSPGQPALVDAHFYASVTDNYLMATHGFNWLNHYPQGMVSSAHVQRNYNNAFWNGSQMAYGDGDGSTFVELSGDLDVVGHELSHGVTSATSNLIYQNESGALNEAFSDIMGSAIEFFYGSGNWTVGEDITPNDNGIRNMANPNEDGDPSHYDERYTGSGDNGGVHINSGIANHWFYLLVNGGQNANSNYASGTDVSGIGLAAAENIAYLGFTALNASANFCAARSATMAVAGGNSNNVANAWNEVGVNDTLCNGGGSGNPGSGTLAVAVSTDNTTYSPNQTVTITVHVEDDQNAAVGSASVDVTLTTPRGSRLTGSATTAASGDATFTYTPRKKDGSGTYNVSATASKSGYTSGTDSTTFIVN